MFRFSKFDPSKLDLAKFDLAASSRRTSISRRSTPALPGRDGAGIGAG